jgi:hypothetical protein
MLHVVCVFFCSVDAEEPKKIWSLRKLKQHKMLFSKEGDRYFCLLNYYLKTEGLVLSQFVGYLT